MFLQQVTHGNILSFTPPGFSQVLNVKFPDSRLAVCEKCKRNYKTRDMCRVRNSHTSEPWTTAFICITLDESCFAPDGETYTDKPLSVRLVPWQSYSVKKPFGGKTPVCAACKKTNRTRSFCRNRHQHKALPWCTVYVVLSAIENGTTISLPPVKNNSKPITKAPSKKQKKPTPNASFIKQKVEKIAKLMSESDDKSHVGNNGKLYAKNIESKLDADEAKKTEERKSDDGEEEKKEKEVKMHEATESVAIKLEDDAEESEEDTSLEKYDKKDVKDDDDEAVKEKENEPVKKNKPTPKRLVDEEEENEVGDDINIIAKSKTFLAKVSCRNISIHWLDSADCNGSSNNAEIAIPQAVVDVYGSPEAAKLMTRQPMPAAFDPSQYYNQMTALGYPQLSQQQAMQMQQQQLMHMQQRQQFAAQQAAWQQYNQQLMTMNGQMMAHGGMSMMPQMPMQAMTPAATPDAQASGGFADETTKENGTAAAVAELDTTATVGAAAFQAQAQVQAQWQAQMMYQQQVYHQQFQMQQMAAAQQHHMLAAQQTPSIFYPAGHANAALPATAAGVTATATAKDADTEDNEEEEEDDESSEEAPAKKAKITEI